MRDKISDRLLSVKSLVTLLLTVIFGYLAVKGIVEGKDFMTVFLMIISFYFGTQASKKEDKTDSDEANGVPEIGRIGFKLDTPREKGD